MEEIMKGDVSPDDMKEAYKEVDEKGNLSQPKSRQRITGPLRTCVNILKVYIGAGILGLPFAFSESGIAASLVLMLVISAITVHTIQMLIRSREEINKKDPNVITFGQLCKASFTKHGKIFGAVIDGLVVFTQLGFCCSYLIFLSQTLNLIFNNPMNWRYFTLIVSVVLTFFTWIRTLKKLAPFATLALFCLISSIIIILVGSLIALHQTTSNNRSLNLNYLNWKKIPNMLSVATFSFEGIGFILPAYTVAKKPEKFFLHVNVCISIVSVFYLVFGGIVYTGLGQHTDSLILNSILDFFPDNYAWKVVNTVVSVLLVISIGLSYPLQFFVAMDILEEIMLPPEITRADYWFKNNFRTFFVFLTGLISIVIPRFDEIMGFIGSLGSSPLMYICPSLIYLSVFWNINLKWYHKLIASVYIVIGIAILISGTTTNFIKLIDSYKH